MTRLLLDRLCAERRRRGSQNDLELEYKLAFRGGPSHIARAQVVCADFAYRAPPKAFGPVFEMVKITRAGRRL